MSLERGNKGNKMQTQTCHTYNCWTAEEWPHATSLILSLFSGAHLKKDIAYLKYLADVTKSRQHNIVEIKVEKLFLYVQCNIFTFYIVHKRKHVTRAATNDYFLLLLWGQKDWNVHNNFPESKLLS